MEAPTKGRFWEIINTAHSKNATEKFCSLVERQILVDLFLFICCGNQCLRVHKIILAANSPLFRSEFERDPDIERVILGGLDFAVVKCLVEYMYGGITTVKDEHFEYFKAAARLLQIDTLEKVFPDDGCTDDVYSPKPQFLTKKPRAILPKPSQNAIPTNNAAVTNAQLQPRPQKPEKNRALPTIKPSQENVPKQMLKFSTSNLRTANMRGKRVLKKQVEQACLKEAQASQMALANLQKEMGSTSQKVNFIVEETCAETCMENFIPQTEENSTYLKTLNHIEKENIKTNSIQLPVAPSLDEGLPYKVLCEISNFSEMQDINGIENNSSNSMPVNHNIMEVGNFLNESEGSFNITDDLSSIVKNFGDEIYKFTSNCWDGIS